MKSTQHNVPPNFHIAPRRNFIAASVLMPSKSPDTISHSGYQKGTTYNCSASEMKPQIQKSPVSQFIFLLSWQSKKKLMSHLQSLKPQDACPQHKILMCLWCGGAYSTDLTSGMILSPWQTQSTSASVNAPNFHTNEALLLILLFLEDGVLSAHPFTLELYVYG